MRQQGQLFRQKTTSRDGTPRWGYRYRTGGRGSRRVQRGGFETQHAARAALDQALESLRRSDPTRTGSLTLAELVDAYLAQHDAEQVTIDKLRTGAAS
jgi:hypothetical protein